MNPVIDLIHAHRSIRRFADEPVPDADVLAAVEAGQAAATSSAVQAYCVLQITDPAVREQLVPLTGGQTKVASSPAFFVICGDSRRHRLVRQRSDAEYRARLEAFLVAAVDASLFAQNLVLAFESMGYGTCYIGGLRNELPRVDELLGLPEGVYPLYGLCVGKPAEAPIARPRLPASAVLFRDRYPDDDALIAQLADYDEQYAAYLAARGAKPRGWTDGIESAFAEPKRPGLAAYYASKGADLS